MIDRKNYALGFVIASIILVLYVGINNQKFVQVINSGNFSLSLFYYFLTRIDYMLILLSFLVFEISTPIKEFFAGILFIWFVDITSFPRLPMSAFPTDPSFLANSDTIIMSKIISLTHWSYNFAWKFYYIILPVILIILVARILGLVNLGRRIE